MESLSFFAGGNFVLGGMVTNNQTLVDYGLSIADAAGAIYASTKTGLGGEFVTWTPTCEASQSNPCDPEEAIHISDGRYRLRPEVLETWYHAYRATKNPKYRDWSWAAFEAINRHCRTETGFSAINDVNAPDGGGMMDVQESFVFAEVLKYVYLSHLEVRAHGLKIQAVFAMLIESQEAPFHVQDSRTGVKNTWVFNTEAHPLRIEGPPK